MIEFVEECRREWKRLGVPGAAADDMASELAADLEEAEAEGASAEDLLGSSASDPRSFATAWAAERGVIGQPPASRHRSPLIPAAIAALTLIAIAGAVLVIRNSPTAAERLAFLPPPPPGAAKAVVVNAKAALAPGRVWVTQEGTWIHVLDTNGSGGARKVGSILLMVALGGIVLLTLSWWRLGSRRSSEGAA